MKKSMVIFVALVSLMGLASAGNADMKGKLESSFYGYVKTDVVYQQGMGIMDNYLLYARPNNLKEYPFSKDYTGDVRNRDMKTFSINSFQTRFGFLITGPEANGVWSRGRIEADFYSKFPQFGTEYGTDYAYPTNKDPEMNKGTAMLRRAYVEFGGDWWSVLAGNEWMVVSPIFPHTNNYTYGADIGNLGYRIPQLRLTLYALDKALQFQIAADDKIGDPGWQDIDTGRASGGPTWEGGIFYNGKLADQPMLFGISGHYGWEGRPNASKKWEGRQIASWSYNVDAAIPIGKYAVISGEWWRGANLDGWFTGGQGTGWIYDPKDNDFSPMQSGGGWIELLTKPIDKFEVIGGWGVDDINDHQLHRGRVSVESIGKTSSTVITDNQMYYAAMNYRLNPATMISFEWMRLWSEYNLANHEDMKHAGITDPTKLLDWDNGVVDRYTLAFWFNFN